MDYSASPRRGGPLRDDKYRLVELRRKTIMVGMSLSTPPSPPINNNDLAFVSALLATLADPAASKKNLTAMLEAREAWQAIHDEAIAKMREADAKLADDQASMANELAEHSAKLASDRTAFDRKCAQREAAIRSREEETDRLNKNAQADAAAAAKLKADYEKRLDLIKKAGAI
jgi:2-hydroxychromene-2-carboxylate isomerase